MEAISKKAFAKLNLTLDVTGRTDDDYHTIISVMQLVDIHDIVTIKRRNGSGILLDSGAVFLPSDSRNVAWKAARAFFRSCSIAPGGLSIQIEKNIPVGAGLGGGSADAAAVLAGLNELYETGLPLEKLLSIGASVGADVPFCILGGTALATGIGEILKPLPPMPDCDIVVCKPPYSCSTPAIYQRYDSQRPRERPDTQGFVNALEKGDFSQMCRRLFNVFECLIPEHSRDIFQIKDTMLEFGAQGASMTGTGSAIFGLYDSSGEAQAAKEELVKRGLQAWVSKPVNRKA